MATTFKLLKEGEIVHRPNGGRDGFVDTWGMEFDAGLTKLVLVNQLQNHLESLTWWDGKDGLPLAEARVAKLPGDTTRAYARVSYGVVGGGGGYYVPLVFCATKARSETLSIPVIRESGVVAEKSDIEWLPKRRTVSVYRFNTRIEQSEVIPVRTEIRGLQNRLRIIDGSIMELVDGGVYRMANGEWRGELIFEQRAKVPTYPPGSIGNSVAVPFLTEHQEYSVDLTSVLPIAPIPATTLYGEPMGDDTFAWMDFNV